MERPTAEGTASRLFEDLYDGTAAEGIAAEGTAAEGTAVEAEEQPQNSCTDLWYPIKKVKFGSRECGVLLQTRGGPCPLLAIANVLSLRGQLKFKGRMIKHDDVVNQIAAIVVESETSTDAELRVQGALGQLNNLAEGMDVNCGFDKIDSFEYTAQIDLHDLLQIQLVHGWLVDPTDATEAPLAQFRYNELQLRLTQPETDETERLQVTTFLNDRWPGQLTNRGIAQLHEQLSDGDLVVLFRSNHFVTLHKHERKLYHLVTDVGLKDRKDVVWQHLEGIGGAGEWFTWDFKLASSGRVPNKPGARTRGNDARTQRDNDCYLC